MNPFSIQGAKLTNANLKGANLQRAYLRHVNLRDTVSCQCFSCSPHEFQLVLTCVRFHEYSEQVLDIAFPIG